MILTELSNVRLEGDNLMADLKVKVEPPVREILVECVIDSCGVKITKES